MPWCRLFLWSLLSTQWHTPPFGFVLFLSVTTKNNYPWLKSSKLLWLYCNLYCMLMTILDTHLHHGILFLLLSKINLNPACHSSSFRSKNIVKSKLCMVLKSFLKREIWWYLHTRINYEILDHNFSRIGSWQISSFRPHIRLEGETSLLNDSDCTNANRYMGTQFLSLCWLHLKTISNLF